MDIRSLSKGDTFYKVYGIDFFSADKLEYDVQIRECECVDISTWEECNDYPNYLGGSEVSTEFSIEYRERMGDGSVRLRHYSSDIGGKSFTYLLFPSYDEAYGYVEKRLDGVIKSCEDKILKCKELVEKLKKR